MWDEYAASIGTTANNLTLAQKRQAEYVGIMKETQFQVGDAATYSDTYAGKLAKLNTAFFNLKVTVGQVITPIVELFLPVITNAINAVTKLFNKLKSVMAAFGLEMKEYVGGDKSGFSSGIDSATNSASGLSSGLDSAGETAKKTAKKIKKAFAGVDEINVLNFNKDNGSSGSGGGTGGIGGTGGGSSIDDTGSFESGASDLIQASSKYADLIGKSAFDWGYKFGEAINNGLGKIPWDAIQSTVVGAVTKVAEFLNGAVDGLDWHLLGSTFGEGFNTVIYGLNAWYKTFDWASLGEGLGEGVNGIIDSVDWEATGEYFSLKFNALFKTLSNFFGTVKWGDLGKNLIKGLNKTIATLDFDAVGETLENGFNGAIDFMWNAVKTFDAKKAGEKLGEFTNNISKAIKNIDWNKLGKTFSEGVHKAIEFLREWIKGVDWGELVKNIIDGITNFLVGIDWGQLALDLGGLLIDVGVALVKGIWQGIKSALVGVGKILYDILVQPIVDGVKDLFGIHSPSTVFAEIGDFLIQGLWAGISGAKDWIIGKWNDVKNWFGDIVKNVSVKVSEISKDVKEKWNKTKDWFKGKTEYIKAGVSNLDKKTKEKWNGVKNWFKGKTEKVKITTEAASKSVKDKWNKTKSWFKGKTENVKIGVQSATSSVKKKWNSVLDGFKGKTVEIKAKVGGVVGNFKSSINDNLIKPLNKKLPSIFPKIPYLAQGGYFKANSPTLAVVGDNKKQNEIVAPENKIYEQVMKANKDSGAAPTQNIEITLNVKYEDGRSIIKKINNTQIQDGKISLLV